MSIALYQKYFDMLSTSYENRIGLYDNHGIVVASNKKNLIGAKLKDLDFTYSSFSLSDDSSIRFSIFTEGAEEFAKITVPIIRAAINTLSANSRVLVDSEYFFKQLIKGQLEDAYWKAPCLEIPDELLRTVFVIKLSSKNIPLALKIIREVAPARENDYIFPNESNEIVFIRHFKSEPTSVRLMQIAAQISTGIMSELIEQPVIAIGAPSQSLETLSRSYKTAVDALNIGSVFENRNKIYSYMTLGISRLITSAPVEKCKAFLNEVLSDNVLKELDEDTMSTVQRFFDYDLNISLTARELYIHRNTLVYRLDRIQDLTGLDVRKFDDALLFKIAMLIQKYLRASRGN